MHSDGVSKKPSTVGNKPIAQPRALLLQGPVGPFFSDLGKALLCEGWVPKRVLFNGGDLAFHRGICAIRFTGSFVAWEKWFLAELHQSRPQVVFLFGSGRPYHVVARRVCALVGVPVWCLEEGYERPDFVTCELGGNNAASPLRFPSDESKIVAGVTAKYTLVRPIATNGFSAMAWRAVVYVLACRLLRPLFPYEVAHRRRPLLQDGLGWARNACRKISYHAKNVAAVRSLISAEAPDFFVVAMQVHDDQQIRVHGCGWTMDRLLQAAVLSFARAAPKRVRLVVKVHPFDRGYADVRRAVARLATSSGVGDRIEVIDDAPIGSLIRHCRGVLTVNSTAGLLALNHGVPVLVLGDALYEGQGLAVRGQASDIDAFWIDPVAPNPVTVEAFTARMRRDSLVNGNFYLAAWRPATAAGILDHVGVPSVLYGTQTDGPVQVAVADVRPAEYVSECSS